MELVTTYWRPRPDDPQPGEKLSILGYLPTDVEEFCPCGSGKHFGTCCRPLLYWRPVCPNPGMQGYSPVRPQAARFTNIPSDVVYAFLQDDERLYCVQDTPRPAFWTYWATRRLMPPMGDLELQKNHTLLVTALSDARFETHSNNTTRLT